ncbi:MAG: right-handed parallel beta-helix repeat-containing protein [Sneathiella sp.]
MAYIEKYLNTDLSTGANDGTSELNAWHSWDDIVWAHGTRVNARATVTPYLFTSTFVPPTLTATDGTSNMIVRGYSSVPGDGGQVNLQVSSGRRFFLNGDCRNITFENFSFTGDTNFSGIVDVSSNAKATFLNCAFENLNTGNNSASRAGTFARAVLINCRATNHGSGAAVISVQSATLIGCKIDAQKSIGMRLNSSYGTSYIKGCEITNAGTGTDGIYVDGSNNAGITLVDGCTIDGFTNGIRTDDLRTGSGYAATWFSHNLITNCTHGYVNDAPGVKGSGWGILNPGFYNIGHDDTYVQFNEASRLTFPSGGSGSLNGVFSAAICRTADDRNEVLVQGNDSSFKIILRKDGSILISMKKQGSGSYLFSAATRPGVLTASSGPKILTLVWDVALGKLFGYLGQHEVLDVTSLDGPTDAVSTDHLISIGGDPHAPVTSKLKNLYFANTHSFDLSNGMTDADLALFVSDRGRVTSLTGTPAAVFKMSGDAVAYMSGMNEGTAGAADVTGTFSDSSVDGLSEFPTHYSWPLFGKKVMATTTPYTDPSSGDYSLNNLVDGGSDLKNVLPLFASEHVSGANYGAYQNGTGVFIPPADPVVSTAACLLPL